MAIDKEDIKKGAFLAILLVALGIGMPLMMGNQSTQYFMIELPNGRQILAQVADSPEKQIVGLFFAKELPPNQGLLMIFSEEDLHPLWTRNVPFAVDMIWMDRDRRIVHIEKNAPPCSSEACPPYGPADEPSLYVLQAAAGFSDANRLETGMELIFRLVQRGG